MGRAEKLLAQMDTNPSGWRYEAVASVVRSHGFRERRGAASHRQWTHSLAPPVTIVAGAGKVAAYPVQQAIRAIRMTLEEA